MSKYRGSHNIRYTVYDNRTDFPVIVDGTSREAATAMGISYNYFHKAVHHSRKGENKRWTILTRHLYEDLGDLED